MAYEFKVVGKDEDKHIVENPDGSRRYVTEEELKQIQAAKKAAKTEK